MSPEIPSPEISPVNPSPEIGPQSAQNVEAPLASPEAGISPEGPVTHESNIKGLEAKLEVGRKELKEKLTKERAKMQTVDRAEMERAYETIEESFTAEGSGEGSAKEIKSFLNRPATHANIEELKERLREGKQELKEAEGQNKGAFPETERGPQPPPTVEEKYRTERAGGVNQEEQKTNYREEGEKFGKKPEVEKPEDTRDYHEILGLSKNASHQEIKEAYLKRAKETHPDIGGDPKEFKKVNEAFEKLGKGNEQEQKIYSGTEAPKQQSPFFYEGGITEEEISLRDVHKAIDKAWSEYRSRTANAGTRCTYEIMSAREEYNHGKFWRTITFSDKEARANCEEKIRSAEATYQQERRDAEEDRNKKLEELFKQKEKYMRPGKKTETIHNLW